MNYKLNYYEILEISESASYEVVRMAYKALALKYHPDKYNGDSTYANNQMQIINEAYDIISDPEKRKKYDEYLIIQRNQNNEEKKEETEKKKNESRKKEEEVKSKREKDEREEQNRQKTKDIYKNDDSVSRVFFVLIGIIIIAFLIIAPFITENQSVTLKKNSNLHKDDKIYIVKDPSEDTLSQFSDLSDDTIIPIPEREVSESTTKVNNEQVDVNKENITKDYKEQTIVKNNQLDDSIIVDNSMNQTLETNDFQQDSSEDINDKEEVEIKTSEKIQFLIDNKVVKMQSGNIWNARVSYQPYGADVNFYDGGRVIKWSSSNPDVAIVTAYSYNSMIGVVEFISPGEAIITAESEDGLTTTAEVICKETLP